MKKPKYLKTGITVLVIAFAIMYFVLQSMERTMIKKEIRSKYAPIGHDEIVFVFK